MIDFFSIQRTMPRLTGNVKLVIDEDGGMSLESINSNEELARSLYKGVKYNNLYSYGANLRKFVSNFTNKSDFYGVIDESEILPNNDVTNTYHGLYDYGCYSDKSAYTSNSFRFFAPLWYKEQLPKRFMIFRMGLENPDLTLPNVDGVADYAEALKNGTLVKTFDLSEINVEPVQSSIVVDFDKMGVYAKGLSLNTGDAALIRTPIDLSKNAANERTLTAWNNNITNSFSATETVYANILNLEFSFNDDTNESAFYRYVGFYVDDSETSYDADKYQLALVESGTGEVDIYDPTKLPESQDVFVGTTKLIQGSDKAPQFRFRLKFNPPKGSTFTLDYLSTNQINIVFNDDILGRTVNDTQQNFVDVFNDFPTTLVSVLATIEEVDGVDYIVLRSTAIDMSYQSMTVTLPPYSDPVAPLIDNSTIAGDFVGVGQTGSSFTYSSTFFIDANKINGVTINRVSFQYGLYLYQLENEIDADNVATFTKIVYDKFIIGKIIAHGVFDLNQETSQYNNVLDFELDDFVDYLTSTVESDDWEGKLQGQTYTEIELEEYRQTVLETITQYRNSVNYNKEFIFDMMDLVTSEATTIDNEYDRLNENQLDSFKTVSKLYPFICKWAYSVGDATNPVTNTYALPYVLNMAFPYRYDNFSPSLVSLNRDLRYHTHSWAIIASGRPPYLPDTQNGYTTIPTNYDEIVDNNVDVANILQYGDYTKIKFNPTNNRTTAFYRGVLLEFDDSGLHDYNFCVLLTTKEQTDNDQLTYQVLRNDELKFYTIILSFFIPDPILTGLEQNGEYWLDRSLLYYSSEIYSTEPQTVDFGISTISLDLYDDKTAKKVYGVTQNTTDFIQYIDGVPSIFVRRGDRTRFANNLPEIVDIGDTLTIFTTISDDINNPEYGVFIEFSDIVEVTQEYFWCQSMIIKSVVTDDSGDQQTSSDDNIIQTLNLNVIDNILLNRNNQPNLLDDDFYNNLFYMSKSIAYEIAEYQKVVKQITNVSRYKEISMANIAEQINKNVDGIDIVTPSEFVTGMSLGVDSDGELEQLIAPFAFPMVRYSGEYSPLMKILKPESDVLLSVDSDGRFRLPLTDLNGVREYYQETFSDVPNIPIEYRSYVSRCLNSVNDTITFEYETTERVVPVIDVLRDYANNIAPDNVEMLVFDTFMKVYTISAVYVNGLRSDFDFDGENITVKSLQTSFESIDVTFIHN